MLAGLTLYRPCATELRVDWSCCAQKTLFHTGPPQPLALVLFFSPFPTMVHASWRSVYGIDALFVAEHSTDTYSLSTDQLHTFALITIHYTKRCIWWCLRAALIYEYRDESLENCLKLRPVSKIIVIGSLLGSVNCSTMCSWPDLRYQAWVSSCKGGLKSIQKVLVTPQWLRHYCTHRHILLCWSLLWFPEYTGE